MNLKKFRAKLGYTQDDIATIIGCSRQTYNDLEKGKKDISDNYLNKLRKLYRCTTAELYGMDIFKHKLESKEEIEYMIRILQTELIGENDKLFADNLKYYRELKGLSIEELSELSGVTSVNIRLLENYRTDNARADTIMKLANALEITYEELVGV